MAPIDRRYFEEYQKIFPQMDVDVAYFFAQAMMLLHRMPILMETYFQKLGLSKGRFTVMVQLYRTDNPEGMNISEIITFHKVKSATMTGIIDNLEREGYIERVQSTGDRRKVNVRMTSHGREFMSRFLPRHHENVHRMLSGLTAKDRQVLIGLMKKLHQGVAEFVSEDPSKESTN